MDRIMKVLFEKAIGGFNDADQSAVGHVHIMGPSMDVDSTACGLPVDEFIVVETAGKITCDTCKQFQEWAKKVSKIK